MKFKKSVAAIAAAAMVMSTMALTPLSVYAAPISVGTSVSGTFSKGEEGTGSINTEVLASWGKAIKATDYSKVVITYSITNLGNASQLGLCLNSGEKNPNGCGWQSTYVTATEGASQTIEYDLSTLGDKSFEWVGLDVLGTSGEAFSGTITIDSYELVEVARDPMIDFGSDVLKTDGSGQYEWVQANFVSNESPEMADADLTGVTKAVFRARAVDLNWGWNNGQFYAQPYKGVGADGKDEGDWQTKSFGGEKSSVDVTLSDTGDFNIEVPFNVIDTNKFYQLGWGTSTGKGAFKLYGIDFYAGSTKIGTWSVTGTWDGPKKAAVSDVVPDTVEVTAAKTAELVGTPVNLEAAVSNTSGETVTGKYTLEWSAPEGATVTPGENNKATLNATKAGEYTVTCTVKAEDGTTYATDSVKVTFTAPINPIDVTADAKELYTGETTQATATRDGKAVSVTWKSSDEKIATVDEKGVITAVGKGTVTITATPEDGSPASVVIKVKEAGQEQKVEQFVDRLYNTLLGRTPDEHSADHKNDLLGDKTACDVARNFVLSEEFLNMGLTNEEVVDKMYMAFLGRPADEAGKADWVNRLNNGCSYAHVFYGFTQCNEFAEICADYGIKVGTYEVESPRDVNCNLTAFVSRLYGKVLGRTYDVPGLDNHTAKYLKTGDIYAMAYDFIFSPEFTKKELTDEEFVELMYNTFFDRGSDPEGKAHWLEVLAGEGTREDVLKGFVGSQECAELVESFKI